MSTNWIDEAIERESIPKAARQESVSVFAKKWGIDESTYYFQMRKPENEKKVLTLSLSQAKKGTSSVLEKLREKAEEGKDMKAMEMYLKFVLALKERTDVTTDDKQLPQPLLHALRNNNSTEEDIQPQETT